MACSRRERRDEDEHERRDQHQAESERDADEQRAHELRFGSPLPAPYAADAVDIITRHRRRRRVGPLLQRVDAEHQGEGGEQHRRPRSRSPAHTGIARA